MMISHMQEREQFLQLIKQKYNETDYKEIERALDFAIEAHGEQKRASGDPYIIHPIGAATTLAQMNLDPTTIVAALLHDVVDDTPRTIEDIEQIFGKEVVFLVSGVSKLGKVRFPKEKVVIEPIETRIDQPIDPRMENLRRMFVAMAEDLRVIFIKFADRLHNMKTLQFLPPDKQRRIALETLEVYAPLAYRLGMWEMRSQLEDLAFPYVYPKEYYWLLLNVEERYEERKRYLERIQPLAQDLLKKEGIEALVVNSRAKHYWSLYRKLLRYQMNFDQIHDLIALRVILKTVAECYEALGIIHLTWKPLPGKIKDYIALPKPNGYQSLHTSVFCEGGKITEFQLRTSQMHEEAEYGAAAHWSYKEGIGSKKQRSYNWIKQLSQWQTHEQGSKDFFESLKIDFFQDRIFVFTPKGDIIDLPEDATCVDFAYAIHSNLGDHCMGAKINGKMAALDTPLKIGDQVDIVISKTQRPNRDWLDFVKTNVARNHIKKWLRSASSDQNFLEGKQIIEKELKQLKSTTWDAISQERKSSVAKILQFSSPDQVLISLGSGDISCKEIIKHLFREEEVLRPAPLRFIPKLKEIPKGISIAGEQGLLFQFAKCCNPQMPHPIIAFITKTRGAAIHIENCPNIAAKREDFPERIVSASWQAAPKNYIANIKIYCNDRIGLLRDVAAETSSLGVNIMKTSATAANTKADIPSQIDLIVEIPNIEKLGTLLDKLSDIEGIIDVRKIQ